MPKDILLNPVVWLSAASAFGLILSLWFIVVLLMYLRKAGRRERLEKRLGLQSATRDNAHVLKLWRDGHTVTTVVPRMSFRALMLYRLERTRLALGWQVPLTTFVLALVGIALLVFLMVLVISANAALAAAAGVVAVAIPLVIARRRINRQTRLFENQLADALSLATRSLRAGHPLVGAFRLVTEEMAPPVSTMFADIIQQQALGVPLDEALRDAAARSPSEDMKLFAASMVIQLRSGGNLADMMERLADVIRDRLRLHRRARVLTAQVQLSKFVLLAVPPFLFVFLFLVRRSYVELLYTTYGGKMMLVTAAVMLLIGTWVMNRMSTLRY